MGSLITIRYRLIMTYESVVLIELLSRVLPVFCQEGILETALIVLHFASEGAAETIVGVPNLQP